MESVKLESRYLVGYLPHGLSLWHNQWKEILIMDCGGSNCDTLSIEDVNEYAKPILRPLSDLTKEIEGVGFPMYILLDIALKNIKREKEIKPYFDSNAVCWSAIVKTKKGCLSLSFDHTDNSFILINDGKSMCVPNQLELFQKLYEWHFDIYGLIEAGLAIDINTLDK